MVDHTFLFTGAVRKISQLLDEGTLGKLYYYDSTRVNLGLFQHDINVLWDLAPHDLSIMDHLIEGRPEAIVATGQNHLNGHEDVAFMTIYFPDNVIAHINVNWLSPVKIRTTLIGGEKSMLVWNDLEADEKLKVYDKGVNITNQRRRVRPAGELPLRRYVGAAAGAGGSAARGADLLCGCITNGKTPFNDGRAGLRVVQMLEAASESLRERGSAGLSMNSWNCIAQDVKLGEDVRLSKFINLYGCDDRRRNEDRRLCRDPEECHAWASAARSPATPSSARAWRSRTTCSSATA